MNSLPKRQPRFSLARLRAFLAFMLDPKPDLAFMLDPKTEYNPQPTMRVRGGRPSFLRPAGYLPRQAPRGYSIPWHSGKVPPPTMGHHLRPRLTPDRLKALRAVA